MKKGPFQLIKFSDKLYGVKQDNELIISSKFQIGAYAIDKLGADSTEVCRALAMFNRENLNYADFGLSGTFVFAEHREVDEYYDLLPSNSKGAA